MVKIHLMNRASLDYAPNQASPNRLGAQSSDENEEPLVHLFYPSNDDDEKLA